MHPIKKIKNNSKQEVLSVSHFIHYFKKDIEQNYNVLTND